MTQLFVGQGANPNSIDADGRAPRHYAVEEQKIEMTKLLVELGSDVNAVDSERGSVLLDAIRTDNVAMAQLLVKLGADVNADSVNKSAEYERGYVFMAQKQTMMRVLLEAGAKLNRHISGLPWCKAARLKDQVQQIILKRAKAIRDYVDAHANGNFPEDAQGILEQFAGVLITKKHAMNNVAMLEAMP